MYSYRQTERSRSLRGRSLRVELLERRDLLTVIRLVDWNALNGPNPANMTDPSTDPDFTKVLQAIGNESVQGNAKRVDILALQETDPAGPGNDSIGRTVSIMNGLYPLANYTSIVSTVDGGGDSTGFVFDTTTVSLQNSVELSASLTHHIMRAKFRPADTTGDSDFYVYTVHLKSGTTGADETARGSEAAILRADADSLGEGAQVLFVGDFNMHTSSEVAYTSIVSAGAAQLQDVADAPGNWLDNPAFKSLHSQDPRSTMDDRFDIQFASGEFFNGVGMEYVPNSFHIFGNNGTHTLNGPITTGTGAVPDVLTALVNASDHLPAVADYQLINSTPNVRIAETNGNTKVVEGGLYDVYSVVLDTVPSANVTVTVTPDSQVDVGNGGGVAKVLTFTPANALTPQFVVVHAVDNGTPDPSGSHTGLITHTSASADAGYNALTINNVNVKVIDNENPVVVINELDSDTPASPGPNDSAEFIELYDGGIGNVSLVGKVLVFYNGGGSNDTGTVYDAINLTGSTNANGYYVIGNTGVAGVVQTFATNHLQNGTDAIALWQGDQSQFANGTLVSGTVVGATLIDAVVYDTSDIDDSVLLNALLDNSQTAQPQVNENGNSLGDSQSIARVPDGGNPRQTTTYVAQAPTPNATNKAATGSTLIAQSGSGLNVTEGGVTDSYQFALLTIPTANVTVTVTPDGQTDLGSGAGVAIMLEFTPVNALIPQTINVTAVDDALVEGNHSSVITTTASTADNAYNGLSIPTVIASIVDNDVAAPTNIVITEIMYNPTQEDGPVGEWVEIYNAGTTPVNLSNWLLDDEDGTNWGALPNGTTLNSNQLAVLFDTDFTTAATFRSQWSVPAGALVIGVSWGSLANNPNANPAAPPLNEILQLLDNHGLQKDLVNYDDASPWPTGANGPSIYLKGWSLDDNAGANWARSTLGSANAVSPAGPTYSTSDVGSPGGLPLPGDYNGNGMIDGADYTVWQDTYGSTTSLLADASGSTPGVSDNIVDQLDFTFWKNNFGMALGSGGESAAGGGGSVVELAAAVPTTLTLDSATAPAPANTLAIDAAVANLTFETSFPRLINATAPGRKAHAANFVAEGDLRVLDLRHAKLADHTSEPPHSWSATYGDDSLAIDELCASLGDHARASRGLRILL